MAELATPPEAEAGGGAQGLDSRRRSGLHGPSLHGPSASASASASVHADGDGVALPHARAWRRGWRGEEGGTRLLVTTGNHDVGLGYRSVCHVLLSLSLSLSLSL